MFFALMLIITLSYISCRSYTASIASRDNNVCKTLRGKVVLYAVFVDTKYTQPWSEYDIQSTLDSIQEATKWIETQGKKSGVDVQIEVANHENKKIIPIKLDFQNKTLSGTLFFPNITVGIKKINKWADRVAKNASGSLPKDTSKVVKTKNNLSDRERLIARLRDIHKTDNVVLMYFINNYYKDEISVTFHSSSSTEIEYAIVSFKQPAVIAHEFLHIFGAWDLYISPFDSKRKNRKRKAAAMKNFPSEIMAFAYRNIDSLEISPFTKYLIGWDNELDKKYSNMMFGKKWNLIKY